MKLLHILLTLPLLISLSSIVNAQSYSESRAVAVHAVIDKSTPSITLKWEGTADASSYQVYRRSLNSTNWGTALASLSATELEYLDTDVSIGIAYEYSVKKQTTTPDPLAGGNINGYGYVSAAIEYTAVQERGTILLLIAKNINDSLPSEIETLAQDMAADGWNVYSEVINATATVTDVDGLIEQRNTEVGCDAVYLLGHLPVPYSGLYCEDPQYIYPPDGHAAGDGSPHCGAWAADVYYGVVGGDWTDADSTTLAARDANDNLIGDGKFDNSRIPGTVTIAVGRVDFANLPVFSKTEIQLTKQYLDKVHQFKIGATSVQNKGLTKNGFAGLAEGFSSGAIRDISAICGADAMDSEAIFTATETNDYLITYGSGAGWYSSCSGYGVAGDFETGNAGAFNHVFGSYFGDWDSEDNFLRSSLASEKLGFASFWSGRPKWVTHTLALGQTYGDITVKSQNNWQDYDANYYQNGTHMSLLGDPSLRHDMLLPVSDLSLTANAGKDAVDVTWTAAAETDLLGYFVYRSHKPNGKYILLNETPVTATSYKDLSPYKGTNFYMVKTAKETTTGSGSYINQSLGTVKEINGLSGDVANIAEETTGGVQIYPTLATNQVFVELNSVEKVSYTVLNNLGLEVASGNTEGKVTSIQTSHLLSGMYYIRIGKGTYRFIKD